MDLTPIEQACEIIQAHNHPQYNEAQEFLNRFKQTPLDSPELCFVLENSRSNQARYFAASAIVEAIKTEYQNYNPDFFEQLRLSLLNVILPNDAYNGPEIETYVARKVCVAIALITKLLWETSNVELRQNFTRQILSPLLRAISDNDGPAFSVILHDTSSRNHDESSHLSRQRFKSIVHAIELVKSLIQEFSLETSCSLGQTFDYHLRCQTSFETEMHLIFIFTTSLQFLQIILARVSSLPSPSGHIFDYIRYALSTILATVSWNWCTDPSALAVLQLKNSISRANQTAVESLVGGSNKENNSTSNTDILIDPPASWRPQLLENESLFTSLFFCLFGLKANIPLKKNFENALDQIASTSFEILEKLSSVDPKSALFPNPQSVSAYISKFFHHIASFVESFWHSTEGGQLIDSSILLQISQIILVLFKTFPFESSPLLSVFGQLPFIQHLSFMTTMSLRIEVNAISRCDDNESQNAKDAFEHFLNAWVMLVPFCRNRAEPVALTDFVAPIFETFVNSKIANAEHQYDDEEDEIFADVDQNLLRETMANLGIIGRCCTNLSLPLITNTIGRLFAEIKNVPSQPALEAQRGHQNTSEVISMVHVLHEKLNWMIHIASHLITESDDGEASLVPEEIAIFCRHAISSGADDPVVILTDLCFQMLDWETQIILNEKMLDDFRRSPVLSESMIQFFTTWSRTYLFIRNDTLRSVSHSRIEISRPIMHLYGRSDSAAKGRGHEVLDRLLFKIWFNLHFFSSEKSLVEATCRLLNTLSWNISAQHELSKTQNWAKILDLFRDIPSLQDLSSFSILNISKRSKLFLSSSIVNFIQYVPASTDLTEDEPTTCQPLQHFLSLLHNQFQSILQSSEFQRLKENPHTIFLVLHYLELFCGITKSTSSNYRHQLIDFCIESMQCASLLIPIYRQHDNVVRRALKLIELISKDQLYAMRPDQMLRFFQQSNQFLRLFDENVAETVVRSFKAENASNDDKITSYRYVLSLLRFLEAYSFEMNRLRREGLDVILLAFHIVLKCLSLPLLNYPKIARSYYEIMLSFCSNAPLTLSLPPHTFDMLLQSLEIGLSAASSESDTYQSLQAFNHLLEYHYDLKVTRSEPSGLSSQDANTPGLIKRFSQKILEFLFCSNCTKKLAHHASLTLFYLVLSEPEVYEFLIGQFIQNQAEKVRPLLIENFNSLTQFVRTSGAQQLGFEKQRAQFSNLIWQFITKVRSVSKVW